MTASSRTSSRKSEVVGLLDIGTAKTACLIVSMAGRGGSCTVLGTGVRCTRGLKAGVVVEMDGVEQAVRGAMADAEEAAGVRLPEISLSVACGRLRAQTFAADAAIARSSVTGQDIDRVMQAGAAFAQKDGRLLIDLKAITYRVDGVPGQRDPIGVSGRSLNADLVAVTADEAPLLNLMHVIGRADLDTARLVAGPYASGLAATTDEDRKFGVLCVDLGAGTTQLSLFAEGHLVVCDVIPVGGNHITFDVARGLAAPLLEAERIKRDYGTLSTSAFELNEVFAYASVAQAAGQGGVCETSRDALRAMIEPRVTSLFAHIAERVERSGLSRYAHRLMVLTGGASQMPGLADAASRYFRQAVQLGAAPSLPGLPDDMAAPQFATVAGMALAPPGYEVGLSEAAAAEHAPGYLRRVGRWLRGSQ